MTPKSVVPVTWRCVRAVGRAIAGLVRGLLAGMFVGGVIAVAVVLAIQVTGAEHLVRRCDTSCTCGDGYYWFGGDLESCSPAEWDEADEACTQKCQAQPT